MKKILIHIPEYTDDTFFNPNEINGMCDPFIYLKEALGNIGYEFKVSAENPLNDCAWILFMNTKSNNIILEEKITLKKIIKKLLNRPDPNVNYRNIYKECIDINFKNIALFLWEPEAVNPESYKKEYLDKFDTIFTWNDDLVDNKKFFKFFLPIPRKKPFEIIVPFNEKKLLTNITANKTSSIKNELYTARRMSIEYFDKYFPDDFDLYGVRWNQPNTKLEKMFSFLNKKYKTYKGISANKFETFSKYKFALCYENMSGLNGFITEKIFDCMLAGCVPIYWGSKNIENYIPKETFVDRSKFKDDKNLAEHLISTDEYTYNKYLEAIKEFLSSNNFKLFLPENFSYVIINILKL